MRHHVRRRLDLVDEAVRLQVFHDLLSRSLAASAVQQIEQSMVGRGVLQKRLVVLERQMRFGIEHIDQRQRVTPPDLEIVEVMRRRDLHGAGAFFGIGVVVADDRDAPPDDRQDCRLADQMAKPLVVRMHRDGDVAEHSLGPRRGDDDEFVAAFDRVFDVPLLAPGLDLLDFKIGDGGFQLGVPVDEPLVLVNEALAVERDEDLEHRARQAFIHGEALARPVA